MQDTSCTAPSAIVYWILTCVVQTLNHILYTIGCCAIQAHIQTQTRKVDAFKTTAAVRVAQDCISASHSFECSRLNVQFKPGGLLCQYMLRLEMKDTKHSSEFTSACRAHKHTSSAINWLMNILYTIASQALATTAINK